jgi:DTW domain-containing protein YfiP
MSRAVCQKCQRPTSVCYCHLISLVENHWPVYILQHPHEVKHAIGTARIAQLSLGNCQIFIGDKPEDIPELYKLIKTHSPLLVFPKEPNTDINAVRGSNVRPLLFLDGSWRKAKRMLYESPLLSGLSRVSFSTTPVSRYKIRKEPNLKALSTLEAITVALGTLESNDRKYQPLLTTMDWMIKQQVDNIMTRKGKDTFEKNYGDYE